MLKKLYEEGKPLGPAAHRKVMRDYRLYMLVGGMPQAVESYIQTNDFKQVDDVKRDILSLYHDDFFKIDPSGKLSTLFEAIPAQLNSNASRYQVSGVLSGNRAGNILEDIAELKDSGTVLVSYHTLSFKDKDFTENDIYAKLLNDKLQTNLGYLYENIIAQTLASNGHDLFYHTFTNEASKRNYEIDFIFIH